MVGRRGYGIGLVLSVATLLALLWTSPVFAQPENDFLMYLKWQSRPDKDSLQALDGYVWNLMNAEQKNVLLSGFFMGKSVLVGYFADLFVRAPKLNYPAAMTQWLGKGAVSLLYLDTLVLPISVYATAIDELYRDTENCDILLIDAVFIVHERLNGRPVDLAEWRKKGRGTQ
jgi:hypothetical protein